MLNNILLIFLDGVGIGKEDYEFNPFFKYGFKTFTKIFGAIPSLINSTLIKDEKYLFPTDARLGIEGLPQSGTGQTSIFCGVNAPKIINQHFGPYPYSTLIPVLKEKNIFKYFLDRKMKTVFANAYPKVFFDYINSGKKRLSVTTLSCLMNEMKLYSAKDIHSGKAISAEITNERWITKFNYKLKKLSPESAAKRLKRIASRNHFTAYEYFLTDHLGHGRYEENVPDAIKILDDFLFTVLNEIEKTNITLIVCSDHGNFEDFSVKTHTLNPALTIAAGKNAKKIFESVKDISQIKNAVIELINSD